jgi:hypothetical protein
MSGFILLPSDDMLWAIVIFCLENNLITYVRIRCTLSLSDITSEFRIVDLYVSSSPYLICTNIYNISTYEIPHS